MLRLSEKEGDVISLDRGSANDPKQLGSVLESPRENTCAEFLCLAPAPNVETYSN